MASKRNDIDAASSAKVTPGTTHPPRKQAPGRPAAALNLTLEERSKAQDKFFSNHLNGKDLLEPFNRFPDALYFVKDTESRVMAVSPGVVTRMGLHSEEEIIGRLPQEYMPPALARKFLRDDGLVVRTGKPMRNIVEVYYNERGVCDWIITDKYPIKDASGRVVGLIGTVQPFTSRQKLWSQLGPIGKAVDYIQTHLGDRVSLPEITLQAGCSERQLQRKFQGMFGITMQQFIIQSRVHAAINELVNTDRTIAEIAAQFGFTHQSAFTNQFREIIGVPPRTYRQRYLEQFAAK
jgi:AraC-like DNA-binding protein